MLTHKVNPKAGRALAIAFLMMVAWTATPAVSSAQGAAWSQPMPLSPEGQFGWFPDVAVDLTGQIHVVWSAFSPPYDVVMYTTSRNGQEWSRINDIAAMPQKGGEEATRPALFVDRYNTLHMTYRSTVVHYAQAPVASAFVANAWRLTRVVSGVNGVQVAYFSQVARDSQGALHLIFSENVVSSSCPICFHLFYRRSEDGGETWTAPIDVSRLATGAAKPQLLIDGQDNLHLVWEAGRGGAYGQLTDPTRVLYTASYDRGTTWASPVELSSELGAVVDGRAKDIAIGLGQEGQLVTAWLSLPEDTVFYRVSTDQGRTWSSPQPIPGVWGGWTIYQARLDDYAMATDSAGAIHLICVGRTSEDQKSLSLLHLVWNGSSWSAPETITTLIGDVLEWPRIAVRNGNQLHVVWYVRDEKHIWGEAEDGSERQFRIWYAQALTSAPEVKGETLLLPTPTPVPHATDSSEQAVAVTPTSSPIIIPTNPADDANYTEADGVLILLRSLLPALVLVGVVVLGARLWKR